MRHTSTSPASARRPAPARRLAWTLSILALGALWLATAAAPVAADLPESSDEPPVTQPAATAAATQTETTAEDEGWLVDETSGREYRIEKLRKQEGAYKWLDEEKKNVLMPLGARFEVVKHDDEWFWVKYYKPQKLKLTRQRNLGPSPEELERIAASYHYEVRASDRLRFQEFDRGLPRFGQWRNGFDVADLNEDGHLDIIFGPRRKGRPLPNIFLGNSQGTWLTWNDAEFPPEPFDYGDVEAGDWNGDGHLDLAFGIHLRGMLALLHDGKGKFSTWSEGIELGHPGRGGDDRQFSSRAIDSIDWNQDGKLDLIAFGEGPKTMVSRGRQKTPQNFQAQGSRGFLVYLNRGDGTWQPFRPLRNASMSRPNFGDGFVIADLNRDQHLDLLSVSGQMNTKFVLRFGLGEGVVTAAELDAVRPTGLVTAVSAADLDGDGYTDLVLAYMNKEHAWRSGIDLVFGGPEGTWDRRPLVNAELQRGFMAVATGDLDGDGHLDLASLSGHGEVFLFLGDGKGTFVLEQEELTQREQGCQGFGLRLVDLDGDGRDEVVASFAGEQVGLTGLAGLSEPGCKHEGSIRVWKSMPASPQPASTDAASAP